MLVKRLLTVEEAAELYRVHPETIRRWVRAGEIEHERAGPRLIRIVVDDDTPAEVPT